MAITVNVGQFPSAGQGVRPVTLDDGATVAQAIAAASLTADGFDVRVNGQPATQDQVLADGDSVVLARKIKGNLFIRFIRIFV